MRRERNTDYVRTSVLIRLHLLALINYNLVVGHQRAISPNIKKLHNYTQLLSLER